MSYIALTRFADLRDAKHIYKAGDVYPRLGYTPTDSRIAELAGSNNRMGFPLIKAEEAPFHGDVVERPEMAIEAVVAKNEETLVEAPETARRGRRGRQRG